MENISGPAVIISNEKGVRTEINMENVICRGVLVFASFRESGKQFTGPHEMYAVKTFSHGFHYDDIGPVASIQSVFDPTPLTKLPPPVVSDIRDLPPMTTSVTVLSIGDRGASTADYTQPRINAIAC